LKHTIKFRQLQNLNEFYMRRAFYNETLLLAILQRGHVALEVYDEINFVLNEFPFIRAYYLKGTPEVYNQLNISSPQNTILIFHNFLCHSSVDPPYIQYTVPSDQFLRDFIIQNYPCDVDFYTDSMAKIYNVQSNLPQVFLL